MADEAVKGLKETQKRIEQAARDLEGVPMLEAMRDATLVVNRDAKINAPVDSGRLRASLTPEIQQVQGVLGGTIQGIVGSNVTYAPFQELGTEFMEGRHYLQRSLDSNQQRIHDILNAAVGKITDEANG